MNKCCNCGVEILDFAPVCPLCRCTTDNNLETFDVDTYPYAERGIRKMKMALRIFVFSAITAEMILGLITYFWNIPTYWLMVLAIFLIYSFITLKFSVHDRIGYRDKMLLQVFGADVVILLIDYISGWHGWSINYVVPITFILMDIAIFVLMMVNHRNWQSYIPLQLLMLILAGGMVLLLRFGISDNRITCIINLFITILLFVGTIILGGKRAREELYRRFHM